MPPLRHVAEAVPAYLLFSLLRLLPADAASWLGGRLGRLLGPLTSAQARARRNLELALPERQAEHAAILRGMWDNLGRVAAEYAHLARVADAAHVAVEGLDHLEAARARGRGVILFSGHLGNWEILGPVARRLGITLTLIYRAPNNPLVERLIRHARGDSVRLLPKGRQAARGAIAAMQAGSGLAMLVDQKMNDGIPVPFFGHVAMTAPALAHLAARDGAAVVPVRVERLGGTRFRVTLNPAIPVPQGRRPDPAPTVMAEVNAVLEGWIRARPEQWLWVHRRWPSR